MKQKLYLSLSFAFFAGCVAALGQAPWSLWFLTITGFFFSFCILKVCRNYKEASLTGFFTGLGYFLVSLFWIMEPFLIPGSSHKWLAPFALFGLSAGLSLFWLVAYGVSILITNKYNVVFSAIVSLSAMEYIRSLAFSGFPWSLIGYTWSDHPIMQLSSIIGPHGLTLFTLLLAGSPFLQMKFLVVRVFLPVFLLLSAWTYGYVTENEIYSNKSANLVRLVQPNAPQHEKWTKAQIPVFWKRQLDFTQMPSIAPLDLIIWPETSVSVPLNEAAGLLKAISEASSNVPTIIGINDLVDESIRNTMALIGAEGILLEKFHKQKLVPFGEYIPLGEWLSDKGISGLAARDGAGYQAGTGERILRIPDVGYAIPLICYELIFPSNVRAEVRPNMIIQVTNDAWFGRFVGPYQHLAQAKFRAVEQALPVIRAANTGISAIIDSKGKIVAQTRLNEATYLDAYIPSAGPETLYTKFADWPIIIFLTLALGKLILSRKIMIKD